MDQRRAGQRPEQRGDQRHVGHQCGDLDAHRFFKRLLNGGVADGADKAQADALQETHGDELFDGGDQQDRRAGDDKERYPGQHHRATAAAIRQRPEQPLQEDAAGQIGGHRGGHPLFAGVEIRHDGQHARLNHIVADIGGELEQHQTKRE